MQTGFERPGEIVVEFPNSLKESSDKYLNMGTTTTYDLEVVFTSIRFLSLSLDTYQGQLYNLITPDAEACHWIPS